MPPLLLHHTADLEPILVAGQPTLLPLPSLYQFIPAEVFSLSPGGPSRYPPFVTCQPPAYAPTYPPSDSINPRVPPPVFVSSLLSRPMFPPQKEAPLEPTLVKTLLQLSDLIPPSSKTTPSVPKQFLPSQCSVKPPASPRLSGVGHYQNN